MQSPHVHQVSLLRLDEHECHLPYIVAPAIYSNHPPHIWQVSLLRLDEHEWAQMLSGAAADSKKELGPIHFAASN